MAVRPKRQRRPPLAFLARACISAACSLALAGLVLAAAEDAPQRPLLVTVDDLPVAAPRLHPDPDERQRITRDLLAVLAKHRVHAVGLVTWNNVQSPSANDLLLLEQWLDAGHELGNHTHGHLDYTSTDSTTYIADVERGREELSKLLARRGQTVRFFRFPYLREGDTPEKLAAMRRYLARTGQRDLPVTIDDQDWSFEAGWVEARRRGDRAACDSIGAEYQTCLRLEVLDHEERGDRLLGRRTPQILLLHANEVGASQWDALLGWLERSGHRFATADEVLADPAFTMPHAFVGRFGCGHWDRLADKRQRDEADAAIRALLNASAAAWNRGDLAGFCSDYAEDALFVSPSGTTRGRQAVLERYRTKFPDRAAMGTLSFDVLEVRLTSGMEPSMLGGARPTSVLGASVVARWSLATTGKTSSGMTTSSGLTLLVLRRRGGGWEIVQDASM